MLSRSVGLMAPLLTAFITTLRAPRTATAAHLLQYGFPAQAPGHTPRTPSGISIAADPCRRRRFAERRNDPGRAGAAGNSRCPRRRKRRARAPIRGRPAQVELRAVPGC